MRPRLRRLLAPLVLAAAWVLAPGCGEDEVGPHSRTVGGRCFVDTDCTRRCVTADEFPGGYCTVTCLDDRDCPGGSVCLSHEGMGICVAACGGQPKDCDPYGVGYQCSRENRQQGGEGALVCIAD